MTLFKLSGAKFFVAMMILVSSLAQAEVRGRGGNNYGPVPGPNDGGNYGPVMPYPDQGDGDYGPVQPYPDDDIDNGNGNGNHREEIYIGRYVRNESIDILREISHLRGSRIKSVRVFIDRAREVNSGVELLVNRRSEDAKAADIGRAVVLKPRSIVQIGRNVNRLEVYARGEMLINRIVVVLANEMPNPPDYGDPREITVTLNLPSYLPPQPRLNLTPYVDVRRYRGYAIRAVEVTAYATRLRATLDLELNSFNEGRIFLDPRQTTQLIRSRQNLVIGSSFGSLVVVPRGDAQIVQVRLVLSRY